MSGVNPVDYLAETLGPILDGHPKSHIEDLMPRRYDRWSSLAAYDHTVALTNVGNRPKFGH
jgi:transposase